METTVEKKTWKQKLIHELSEYFVNAVYLTVFFGVFAISRRLTLSQFGIYLDDYFIGLIKALIIAKVIMIGAFLRISRKFEGRPLIIPVLYKVCIFVLWVILFDALEGLIKGLIQSGSLSGTLETLVQHHFNRMWLGGLLVVILSFIPFFALKELSRIMGHEKFRDLFLKQRPQPSNPEN
jgi:hypothetical protein